MRLIFLLATVFETVPLASMDFVIWFLIFIIAVIAGVIVWKRAKVGKGEGAADLSVEDYSGGDDDEYDEMMHA